MSSGWVSVCFSFCKFKYLLEIFLCIHFNSLLNFVCLLGLLLKVTSGAPILPFSFNYSPYIFGPRWVLNLRVCVFSLLFICFSWCIFPLPPPRPARAVGRRRGAGGARPRGVALQRGAPPQWGAALVQGPCWTSGRAAALGYRPLEQTDFSHKFPPLSRVLPRWAERLDRRGVFLGHRQTERKVGREPLFRRCGPPGEQRRFLPLPG